MSRYSNDLRKKVIEFYHIDNTKSVTARNFGISRPTLDDWLALDKQGKLYETKEYHHGQESKVDLIELQDYVDNQPDVYLRELEQVFPLKKSQLSNLLRDKLGYRRKKNGTYTKKDIERSKNNL